MYNHIINEKICTIVSNFSASNSYLYSVNYMLAMAFVYTYV